MKRIHSVHHAVFLDSYSSAIRVLLASFLDSFRANRGPRRFIKIKTPTCANADFYVFVNRSGSPLIFKWSSTTKETQTPTRDCSWKSCRKIWNRRQLYQQERRRRSRGRMRGGFRRRNRNSTAAPVTVTAVSGRETSTTGWRQGGCIRRTSDKRRPAATIWATTATTCCPRRTRRCSLPTWTSSSVRTTDRTRPGGKPRPATCCRFGKMTATAAAVETNRRCVRTPKGNVDRLMIRLREGIIVRGKKMKN